MISLISPRNPFITLPVFLVSFFLFIQQGHATPGENQHGGPPYHLEKTDPQIYRATIYKVYLVRSDDLEVTLYENANGITLDMANGVFSSLADVTIPPGSYDQVKIITSRTFGLKGYCLYNSRYYYTKNGTDQSDIGGKDEVVTDVPTGRADYGTQTTTLSDAGAGTEATTYNGNAAFIYTSSISLNINLNEKPTIRAEFVANDALELNDSTVLNGTDNGAPAQITFSAPQVEISSY